MKHRSTVIKCQNIKLGFKAGPRSVEVLHGINLEIKSGEFVILYGPSGSGKSTLLDLIGGLEQPTEGKIFVRGQDITQLSSGGLARFHRVKIGFVFQQFNLIPSLPVWMNVSLPQVFSGVGLSRRKRRAEHLLENLGLKDLSTKRPTELSGGEQQRVSIARALVNNPWILLVDEPTGNLDTRTGAEVMHILYELNQRSKRTILLVTHNPNYLRIGHRLIELVDGRIVKERLNLHPSWPKGADHFRLPADQLTEEAIERIP